MGKNSQKEGISLLDLEQGGGDVKQGLKVIEIYVFPQLSYILMNPQRQHDVQFSNKYLLSCPIFWKICAYISYSHRPTSPAARGFSVLSGTKLIDDPQYVCQVQVLKRGVLNEESYQ